MATKRKRSAKRGANPGTKRKRSTTKRKGTKRSTKRKGTSGTFRRKVERFMTAQKKWNRAMESGVNHLYTVTKAAKPAAFKRLPRV